jgi:hypothetical protein
LPNSISTGILKGMSLDCTFTLFYSSDLMSKVFIIYIFTGLLAVIAVGVFAVNIVLVELNPSIS